MKAKKNPPLDCSREKGKVIKHHVKRWEEVSKEGTGLQARIVEGRGFVLQGFKRGGKGKPENLKIREEGDITGWSPDSRRRFRRWLLDNRPPPGWHEFGATFTIPGGLISPDEAKALWAGFCKHLARKGLLVVWRCEVQGRGALHWHCIVAFAPSATRGLSIRVFEVLRLHWHECIEKLGAVRDYVMASGTVVEFATSRMALPGAYAHAVDIQPARDGDAWFRYIADHASKAKQEQIGQNIGRHWGIVGRAFAVPSISREVSDLTYEENFRLRRALRRLCTPSFPNPSDPFGRSLGFSPKSSLYGRQDRFGHTQAVARLLKWVKTGRG